MKPQKQKYRHKPEEGQIGDCHRTALACLLDMDRDEVPHFAQTTFNDTGEFNRLFDAWLADKGYKPVEVVYQCCLPELLKHQGSLNPTAYYLLAGISRNGVGHSVIGLGGAIVWDPSLDDSGITGPMDDGFYWVTYLTPIKLHKA